MEFKILRYDSIDSTNEEAKRLIPDISDWTTIISREQTKGKGRSGRSWQSNRDKGLYMSIVFKVEDDFKNIAIISFLLSIAIVEYIYSIDKDIDIGIKWPNDILVNNRKLCGILPEIIYSNNKKYLICGIGINLEYNKKDFKESYKNNAISLNNILRDDIEKELLEVAIIENFYSIYKDYNINGSKDIMKRYKNYSLALNKYIRLIYKDNIKTAYVKDILDTGEILVDIDGVKKKINYGEISIRGIDGYF